MALGYRWNPCRLCFNEKSGPSQGKIRIIFKPTTGQAAIWGVASSMCENPPRGRRTLLSGFFRIEERSSQMVVEPRGGERKSIVGQPTKIIRSRSPRHMSQRFDVLALDLLKLSLFVAAVILLIMFARK